MSHASSAFDRLLAATHVAGGAFHAHVAEDWMQGRTAYGGLSAALALAAVRATQPVAHPLRSAQIAFAGPVAGDNVTTTEMLRQGRSSQFATATVRSGETVGTHALFHFAAARQSAIAATDLPMPKVADPEVLPDRPRSSGLPAFMAHYDMRFAGGEALASGAARGEILAWVRYREPVVADPMIALLALADALPPAAFTQFPAPAPISTTSWQMHFLTETPATEDGWWLIHSHGRHAAHGFSAQDMRIWNRRGQAIATGGQGVALYA